MSIPYLLSHGLAPAIISSPTVLIALQRRIYPLLLLITALAVFFTVQARQFKKLVEHIKNDRYRRIKYNIRVVVIKGEGGGEVPPMKIFNFKLVP